MKKSKVIKLAEKFEKKKSINEKRRPQSRQ